MPETRPEIRAAREPLTPTEFKRSLEQGLGRAILCLQKHDPAPYKEIVLEACLFDTRYHPQPEGSRVPYLMEAIKLTGDEAYFQSRILEAYIIPETESDADDEEGSSDLEQQLTDFAFEFAKLGSEFARTLLYKSFAVNPRRSIRYAIGRDDAIIELDGLDGVRFVLEQYARVAKHDPDFRLNGFFNYRLEVLGASVVQDLLKILSAQSADLKELIERSELLPVIVPNRAPKKFTKRPLLYPQLTARIQRRYRSTLGMVRWGESVNQTVLKQAARDLLLQTDPELIYGYLCVFRNNKFPMSARHLVKLAQHENADVRDAALIAMQHIQHPAVRALALALRHQPETAIEAVGMLESNYESGDSSIIMEAIRKLMDDLDAETIHMFSSRIRDIYRKNRVPEALEPLTALYEVNPCSNCREGIIKLTQEIGILPDWMLEEAMWDSREHTRANTRAWIATA